MQEDRYLCFSGIFYYIIKEIDTIKQKVNKLNIIINLCEINIPFSEF